MISIALRSVVVCLFGLLATRIFRRVAASAQHAIAFGVVIAAGTVLVFSVSMPIHTVAIPTIEIPVFGGSNLFTQVPIQRVSVANAHLPLDWAGFLAVLWATGAVVFLARLIASVLTLRARLAKSTPIDGLLEGVRVVEVRGNHSPAAAWLGRHTILLPTAWKEWDPLRLQRVLRHELAHVRRWDALSRMAALLVCALLWPNPLVWLFAKRARDLAEEAADDLVLAAGSEPSSYATDLLDLASQRSLLPSLAIPIAQKRNLSRRIEMILDPHKRRGGIRPALAILVSAFGLAACVPVSTWAFGHTQKNNGKPTDPTPSVSFGFHMYGYDTTKQVTLPFTHTITLKAKLECGECHAGPQTGRNGLYSSQCLAFLVPDQAAQKVIDTAVKSGERLQFDSIGATDWTAKIYRRPTDPDACGFSLTPAWISDKKSNVLLAISPDLTNHPDQILTVDAVVPKGSSLLIFDTDDHRLYVLKLVQLRPNKHGVVSYGG